MLWAKRRFRASQLAGLTEVPAIIKELSDEDMMELVLIENLQREDLNAIEEAESYKNDDRFEYYTTRGCETIR